MEPRLVTLPSGAILKVQPAPFAAAKALYQAVLREIKDVEVSASTDMASLYKDLFCIGFSSPAIEACLKECFKRCTIDYGAGDLKITDDTFEPVERREDFGIVCMGVAKDNILPFGKSLYAEFQRISATPVNAPK